LGAEVFRLPQGESIRESLGYPLSNFKLGLRKAVLKEQFENDSLIPLFSDPDSSSSYFLRFLSKGKLFKISFCASRGAI
jgi:hypothetical protein